MPRNTTPRGTVLEFGDGDLRMCASCEAYMLYVYIYIYVCVCVYVLGSLCQIQRCKQPLATNEPSETPLSDCA